MVCRQAGAFAGRGEWVTVGARNPEAWIATCSRVERRQARRRLRVSEMLRAMDLVDEAFVAGLLSIEHVEVLAHARNRSKATAAAFGRDEQLLVSWATAEPFHRFRHLVDEWLLHADEDDAEDRAARQHAQRRMHLSQSFENQWFGDLVLDPVNGEILNATLTRITSELFELDWAVTKKLLGRDPTGIELAELARTPAQRRADALVEMARRAETAPTNARTPRPLFTVLVGEQSFARVCELASGTIVARGAVAGWLNDALLERIVFDGPNRVLSVGHQRSFRGALRRAIEVRDRSCTNPYCDTPAELCDIDHVQPHAMGGPTTFTNGRALCGFHNRQRHDTKNHPGFSHDHEAPPGT